MAMAWFVESMITDATPYCPTLPKPANMTFTQSKITDVELSIILFGVWIVLFVVNMFYSHSHEIYDNQLYYDFKSKKNSVHRYRDDYWQKRKQYMSIKRKYSGETAGNEQIMAKRRRESLRSFKKLNNNVD
jgi:hypothetical protein